MADSSHSGAALGPLLLAVVVILAWSACFVVIEASWGSAPPMAFAALRGLVAAVILLPLAGGTAKPPMDARAWGWIVALGLVNTTLGLAAMFLSVGLAGATLPGVLANSQALIVAPFAALLFREPLGPRRVAALAVGTAGVALMMAGGSEGGTGTFTGAALGLPAAVGLACANLIMKRICHRVGALSATAWQYAVGAAPLLVWSLIAEDWVAIAWNGEFIAALLFLGVVGSAMASYVWYRLVQQMGLIRLNALTLLTPLFALALGLAFSREPLTFAGGAGAVLILCGVAGVVASPAGEERADEGSL